MKPMRTNSRPTGIFLVISLLLLNSCIAYTNSTLEKYDGNELSDQWLSSNSLQTRKSIVYELERRKDINGLVEILESAITLLHQGGSRTTGPYVRYTDVLPIIHALGRLKNPDTVDDLFKLQVFHQKKIQLALLEALKQINDPNSAHFVARFYKNPDRDVRLQALAVLGAFKSPQSIDTLYAALFDEDALVRWKAVHLLGELGDPESVEKIGLLLSDKDESVSDAAEQILETLGVPSRRISDWKEKAKNMSIDDFYQTQLAYKKAISEKQSLQEQLDLQQLVKQELEEALRDRESTLRRKEDTLTFLYEKERQLANKAKQAELSAQQSKAYSLQLKLLNERVAALTKKLKLNTQNNSTKMLKKEMVNALSEKAVLEKKALVSRQNEDVLKMEMIGFEKLVEKARVEVKHAQRQVAEIQNRESFLPEEVDNLGNRLKKGMEPVVLISNPKNHSSVESASILLSVFVVDDNGINNISIRINDQPVSIEPGRGLNIVSAKQPEHPRKVHFTKRLNLVQGENLILISVTDTNGMKTVESVRVTRIVDRGQFFAAIIGINHYENGRNLKYAVNDASAVRNYFGNHIGIPESNIFYLKNQQATKENILSVLGTRLKRKAGKADTVFIFFAGHGAVENDPLNLDGDGLEKYLLPYDANLDDLYSTSISMDEVQKIFQRISAERLVFIVDSCYSGATGGRTILASRARANLSEKFYERISAGKGRVIISSSSANEVSQESEKYQHGLFTYFLLKGLEGEADYDNDELISIDEAFSYISKTVPRASGQDQHPVKKGDSEGQLIIGRIK